MTRALKKLYFSNIPFVLVIAGGTILAFFAYSHESELTIRGVGMLSGAALLLLGIIVGFYVWSSPDLDRKLWIFHSAFYEGLFTFFFMLGCIHGLFDLLWIGISEYSKWVNSQIYLNNKDFMEFIITWGTPLVIVCYTSIRFLVKNQGRVLQRI